GAGYVLPDDLLPALATAQTAWRLRLRPTDCAEEHLVDDLAFHDTQLKQIPLRVAAQIQQHARHAATGWDLDQQTYAAQLGHQLANAPGLIRPQLEGFLHGCDWLLGRWNLLAGALQERGDWTVAERSLAIHLMGETADEEVGAEAPEPAVWQAMVAGEWARLEALRSEGLEEQDAEQRAAAELGWAAEHSPGVRRLRRYWGQHQRAFGWAWEQLTALRRSVMKRAAQAAAAKAAASGGAAAKKAPAPKPTPELAV